MRLLLFGEDIFIDYLLLSGTGHVVSHILFKLTRVKLKMRLLFLF